MRHRPQPQASAFPPSLRRDFIEQHYVTLKKANPDFPILIRECSGVQPKLWARYGKCGGSPPGAAAWGELGGSTGPRPAAAGLGWLQ